MRKVGLSKTFQVKVRVALFLEPTPQPWFKASLAGKLSNKALPSPEGSSTDRFSSDNRKKKKKTPQAEAT